MINTAPAPSTSSRRLVTNIALWQVVAVLVGVRIGEYLVHLGGTNFPVICVIFALLLVNLFFRVKALARPSAVPADKPGA